MSQPRLETLLESARLHEMSDKEREEQRRSFAYGNIKLHNPNLTRADIDMAAEELANDKGKGTER